MIKAVLFSIVYVACGLAVLSELQDRNPRIPQMDAIFNVGFWPATLAKRQMNALCTVSDCRNKDWQ